MTAGPTGCNANRNELTTPKFPPPPRSAQRSPPRAAQRLKPRVETLAMPAAAGLELHLVSLEQAAHTFYTMEGAVRLGEALMHRAGEAGTA